MLDRAVESAMVITNAPKANIQILNRKSGILHIAVQRGFRPPFLKSMEERPLVVRRLKVTKEVTLSWTLSNTVHFVALRTLTLESVR